MLQIDGTTRLLTDGERSPEGVKLISANSRRAVLEIDGKRSTHSLGSRVSTAFADKSSKRVSIYRDSQGMFTTVGSINGLPVTFLLDTGASAIALDRHQAKRLGVSYRLEGNPIRVQTAAGTSKAYAVKLDTVKVGDIVQRNVDAFVIENDNSGMVLLGMSYLGRVKMRDEGQVMHLEQKY